MLYLISIGLYDEKDMSLRALEMAKKCDSLYVEFYTNRAATDAGRLSGLIGKPVKELKRHGLEGGSGSLLDEARNNDVGVLVPGDALTATTHVSLLLDAKNKGVKSEIVHGSSIVSAVGETGLQVYKFGRTTTLTDPVQASTINAIESNRKSGLHTLVLLDIGMTASHGLGLLKDYVKGDVAVACSMGGNGGIIYDDIKSLMEENMELAPAVIIIPGELHFMEKEYLETMRPHSANP